MAMSDERPPRRGGGKRPPGRRRNEKTIMARCEEAIDIWRRMYAANVRGKHDEALKKAACHIVKGQAFALLDIIQAKAAIDDAERELGLKNMAQGLQERNREKITDPITGRAWTAAEAGDAEAKLRAKGYDPELWGVYLKGEETISAGVRFGPQNYELVPADVSLPKSNDWAEYLTWKKGVVVWRNTGDCYLAFTGKDKTYHILIGKYQPSN